MVWVIIEWNGKYDNLNLVCFDKEGMVAKFDFKEEAEKFAKENCAFEYKIVEVN